MLEGEAKYAETRPYDISFAVDRSRVSHRTRLVSEATGGVLEYEKTYSLQHRSPLGCEHYRPAAHDFVLFLAKVSIGQ